ncbi:MAG TPA: carbohydrate-binding module family 20 domain-containing protein [Polyangiaceae bacterium]|jgi:hypothetical protein|nr:carbohydrate-binding module family 20 domain-containing protein [Polyangiaceae bacterium]
MRFPGTTNLSPLLAAPLAWTLVALAACSGSATSGLAMPPPSAVSTSTPDAGSSAPYPSQDGAADTQSQSTPQGTPLVERGDDVAPDSGLARDAATTSATIDGSSDAGSLDTNDAGDASPPPCAVAFTVTSALVDGLYFTSVVLGGDAPALGSWDPARVVAMTPSATVGAWTATATLAEGTTVHFKFGMTSSTGAVTWESAPASTDRALLVDCSEAAAVSYVGQYNMVPDAGPGEP